MINPTFLVVSFQSVSMVVQYLTLGLEQYVFVQLCISYFLLLTASAALCRRLLSLEFIRCFPLLGNVMVVIEALCSQLNGPSNWVDASQDTGLLKWLGVQSAPCCERIVTSGLGEIRHAWSKSVHGQCSDCICVQQTIVSLGVDEWRS